MLLLDDFHLLFQEQGEVPGSEEPLQSQNRAHPKAFRVQGMDSGVTFGPLLKLAPSLGVRTNNSVLLLEPVLVELPVTCS